MEEDEIELLAADIEVDVQEQDIVVNPMSTVGGKPTKVTDTAYCPVVFPTQQ